MAILTSHLLIVTLLAFLRSCSCQRPIVPDTYYDKNHLLDLQYEVKELFYHAYDSYIKYAYPSDELQPLTCRGVDTWGSYSLTLIDALDTLLILGNQTEFQRIVELLSQRKDYDNDINVSVFETNIRILGGLLSAHLLSHKAGMDLEPGWPCNGPLLRLAEDVGRRLLPAFNSSTGMPYGTVNLRYGVPKGETPVTCTAGVGTFIVEFGTLSRLTGDSVFENVALKAMESLYDHRSGIGLLGNHINVETGQWIATDSGIGAAVDSYFEYLVKGAALLSRPELMETFWEHVKTINEHIRKDDWYFWVTMTKGAVTSPVFQNLEAYWPGVLSMAGLNSDAMRTIQNYYNVLKHVGFVPEMYDVQQGQVRSQREGYPLRPELVESLVYLYRATGDKSLLAIGEDVLRAIQHSARTPCGYATVKDTRDHRLEDRMESFFLAETTKYLYLLFDPEHYIHGTGNRGKVHKTGGRTCILDSGGYVFNTEAHPIDIGSLDCCYGPRDETVWNDLWLSGSLKMAEPLKSLKVKESCVNYEKKESGSCEVRDWKYYFYDLDMNKVKVEDDVVEKSRKSNYELLTCHGANYFERLCLNGEICEL